MKAACTLLLVAVFLAFPLQRGFPQGLPSKEDVIGAVQLQRASLRLDRRVRGELDALIPTLAALGPGHIVKVEAWIGKGHGGKVVNSMLLALEAQRYIRKRLGPGRELYIAAAPHDMASDKPFIRVTAISDSFLTIPVISRGERER